jgi:hypothetical protein
MIISDFLFQISNFRFQITSLKSEILNLRLLIAIGMVCFCAEARGDGGTLQVSQRSGDLQISVFTSPAMPRVGLLDVSVLVQDAETQTIRDDVAVQVRLEHADGQAIPLQETATAAWATNRLFKAAQFDVTTAGVWRVIVSTREMNVEPLRFDLEISPPLPPWLQLAPWIGWPFGLAILFLIHKRLAAAQCTRHAPS